MYPLPVDPTPTLTFSTKILSPTEKGKELIVLNPTDKVAVAVPVDGIYVIFGVYGIWFPGCMGIRVPWYPDTWVVP